MGPREALQTVEAMIAAEATFMELEDFINHLGLDEDYKASLWLLAWAERPPQGLHTVTRYHAERLEQY